MADIETFDCGEGKGRLFGAPACEEGGYVSSNNSGEHAELERLTIDGRFAREIRIPHSTSVIWKQMERLTIEENTFQTCVVGGKRKLMKEAATRGETSEPAAKKSKLVDEILSEVLAECSAEGGGYLTYLAEEKGGSDGRKEECEELLLSLLAD